MKNCSVTAYKFLQMLVFLRKKQINQKKLLSTEFHLKIQYREVGPRK
jgi:hypothetical protein